MLVLFLSGLVIRNSLLSTVQLFQGNENSIPMELCSNCEYKQSLHSITDSDIIIIILFFLY